MKKAAKVAFEAWAVGDASDNGFEEEPTPTSMKLHAKVGGSEEGVDLMDGHVKDQGGRRANGAAHATGAGGRCERIQRSRGLLMGRRSLRALVFKVGDEKMLLILLILSADPL